MVKSVGFTGTQQGMTKPQRKAFKKLLRSLKPKKFRHGDCIGADSEAHAIAISLGCAIWIHPPENDSKRAYCKDYKWMGVPKPYLTRNHDIVDNSKVMIATPSGLVEELRSGTWATIRYARKARVPLHIIYPDGSYQYCGT